jgi:hypothetical protein
MGFSRNKQFMDGNHTSLVLGDRFSPFCSSAGIMRLVEQSREASLT